MVHVSLWTVLLCGLVVGPFVACKPPMVGVLFRRHLTDVSSFFPSPRRPQVILIDNAKDFERLNDLLYAGFRKRLPDGTVQDELLILVLGGVKPDAGYEILVDQVLRDGSSGDLVLRIQEKHDLLAAELFEVTYPFSLISVRRAAWSGKLRCVDIKNRAWDADVHYAFDEGIIKKGSDR